MKDVTVSLDSHGLRWSIWRADGHGVTRAEYLDALADMLRREGYTVHAPAAVDAGNWPEFHAPAPPLTMALGMRIPKHWEVSIDASALAVGDQVRWPDGRAGEVTAVLSVPVAKEQRQ